MDSDAHVRTASRYRGVEAARGLLRCRTSRSADVLLIVEVADSTLRFDTDIKLPLYARHGIPQVWLVDIEHTQFTVYSGPGAEEFARMETPPTRIAVAGVPDVAVDLSGLF